ADKKRVIDVGVAAARDQLNDGRLRLGRACRAGRGRLVFTAGSWERTDVVRVPGGGGKSLSTDGRELASVERENGDALVLFREVPPLGYLALTEADREAREPAADGEALEVKAGGFTVQIDQATGAIRSLTGPDGKERVKPSDWSGLNQLVYARGGEHSALWTSGDRDELKNPPQLALTQAKLVRARRERLPGIGVRLVIERALDGFPSITSTITLYDELPWVDIENRIVKTATLTKEALYFAFPFAFLKPVVDVEVPLGRMTVERDQQPGSCRDWYCHTHWVWLHEGNDGVLWSGPGTPLFTLNDLFRGAWRVSTGGAKPADAGDGVIVKVLDIAGQARGVGIWPAAYAFKLARRTTLVEQNGDAITVGGDGRASLDLAAWGVAAARLFTPGEAS